MMFFLSRKNFVVQSLADSLLHCQGVLCIQASTQSVFGHRVTPVKKTLHFDLPAFSLIQILTRCLSHYSLAVMRCHDQGSLQKKGFIWSLWFQRLSP